MLTFYLATLGCKINQYESQAIREGWTAAHYRETLNPAEAHYIVVNSCAVTSRAVADLRNSVRKLHKTAPQAAIIITGCAAEVLQRELSELPGVTAVVPQHQKKQLAQPCAPANPGAFCLNPAANSPTVFPPLHIHSYARSRAVVKIQDGCSHRCTYCIVPLTRGMARSRRPEDSLEEISRLLEKGFREIIISGVNLSQYGKELQPRQDFWDFINQMQERFSGDWTGVARFRISSLEPGQLTQKALTVLQNSTLIAPHLHLSLQSGSREILQRMGRGHYTPDSIAERLSKLSAVWPLFGLGADILTGFPGETEAEFLETLRLCQQLPLSYAHVFPYSPRPGTPAASFPGQVAASLKKERAAQLRSTIVEKKKQFLRRQLQLPVMHLAPELPGPGSKKRLPTSPLPILTGVNDYYCDCTFSSAQALPPDQTLLPVQAIAVEGETLLVSPLPQ